jgi:catechol 1,2-dioxygenase
MASALVQSPEVQQLLERVSGAAGPGGTPRVKQILRRIVSDLYSTIDEFDITPEEFWATLGFFQAGAMEFGLIAPGLGFDRFLDIRMDAADKRAGIQGGTPRAIEGPLYVPGAPLSTGFARLDDGTDNAETLIMSGHVFDLDNKPIAGAIVDVWHANSLGNYSFFDPSQSKYNNRRRIQTGPDGAYKLQSILPSGYAVPPGGATERLMNLLGRHGKRPAHIHFLVSAPGKRLLTTQINICGDPLLHDDFALATREGLIPDLVRRDDPAAIREAGVSGPFVEIVFDFVLHPAQTDVESKLHERPRVSAIT